MPSMLTTLYGYLVRAWGLLRSISWKRIQPNADLQKTGEGPQPYSRNGREWILEVGLGDRTYLKTVLLILLFLLVRSNVAVLHVYYKDKTGMRYKTDIRFGVEDFICKKMIKWNINFLWYHNMFRYSCHWDWKWYYQWTQFPTKH